MIINATSRTKTANSGMMAMFRAFLTLGESNTDEEMSSFDERRRIRTTAIKAPPIPKPIGDIKVTALDIAEELMALDSNI